MNNEQLDTYVRFAAANYEAVIEPLERYKLEKMAPALQEAREAVLSGNHTEWLTPVLNAIKHPENNIIWFGNKTKLTTWINNNQDTAHAALSGMWTSSNRTPADRVRAFDRRFPESLIPKTASGTRCNIAAYLMMGFNAEQHPPYLKSSFSASYKYLKYPPSRAKDAGSEYAYALGFLDRLLEEFHSRGFEILQNRMEAQSVVWYLNEYYFKHKLSLPPLPMALHNLNTILYGPPGTGKTWYTVTHAVAIVENREVEEIGMISRGNIMEEYGKYRDTGQIEMITFHQNTTYEDFVEGIRPVLTTHTDNLTAAANGTEVQYELSPGVLRRITERAEANPDSRFVLIIDEINRGNIARIFGELITLIEDSKRLGQADEARVTLPVSNTSFGLPKNLYFLGTMNTADRSIALLDSALRRRFVFHEMMPDASLLKSNTVQIEESDQIIDCEKILNAMNRRITALLDREHQIGHTYFLKVDSLETLKKAFQNQVIPLLQEYFFDDWTKIRAILNDNGFITESKPPKELITQGLIHSNHRLFDRQPADHESWDDPSKYQTIYGQPQQNANSTSSGS